MWSALPAAEVAWTGVVCVELGVAVLVMVVLVMIVVAGVADEHREQADQPAGHSCVEYPGQYVPDTAENQVLVCHDG
jgi:hypothetical protein